MNFSSIWVSYSNGSQEGLACHRTNTSIEPPVTWLHRFPTKDTWNRFFHNCFKHPFQVLKGNMTSFACNRIGKAMSSYSHTLFFVWFSVSPLSSISFLPNSPCNCHRRNFTIFFTSHWERTPRPTAKVWNEMAKHK